MSLCSSVIPGMAMMSAIQSLWMLSQALELFHLSNSAHTAVVTMYDPVVATLDRISLDATDQKFIRAVSLFYLTVTARPPQLSLSGFSVIGRPLFLSVASQSITYLIIMMQFRTDMSPS
ncbi:Gustatory and odorant receptor 22 [Frankliniella fusca]|uniref:Gustatory and odorant receptor 22 n=1 Tax=Frankliniella fusca TaxID=407009 RepID=A0AAE1GT13_9NEOP|nr:Gustatory and odorant receptor 22 [Frankliniella fusca]